MPNPSNNQPNRLIPDVANSPIKNPKQYTRQPVLKMRIARKSIFRENFPPPQKKNTAINEIPPLLHNFALAKVQRTPSVHISSTAIVVHPITDLQDPVPAEAAHPFGDASWKGHVKS